MNNHGLITLLKQLSTQGLSCFTEINFEKTLKSEQLFLCGTWSSVIGSKKGYFNLGERLLLLLLLKLLPLNVSSFYDFINFESWNLSFSVAYSAAAKSLQSCLTLCDPIDSSPPASPVPGILQARTLEWVAISFSNE